MLIINCTFDDDGNDGSLDDTHNDDDGRSVAEMKNVELQSWPLNNQHKLNSLTEPIYALILVAILTGEASLPIYIAH